MHRFSWIALSLAVLAGPAQAVESLLERDVLPILSKHCLACHGGLKQKGGLDLRSIEAALKGGDSGPAVKVKESSKSELWKRIESNEMPPGEKKLSAVEKMLIKQWIDDGLPTVAQRQKDDSPLVKPGVKHPPQEVASAIDRHIDKGLSHAKLKARPRSDDAEFLRRIYLDLAGSVPPAEKAAEFLDSKEPDKRTKLIDSLLDSPQFGEQFGRTWREWICPPELPSDGNGGAQPYRESQAFGSWIGARVRANDGWDKIVQEIVAVDGEIKAKPQVIFHALVGEGGESTPAGSARAVASLFMGVQIQCAECHDDPFRNWSQKEFWALSAFFHRTRGSFSKISESSAPQGKKPGITGIGSTIIIPKSAFKNAGTSIQAAFLGGKEFQTDKDEPLRPPFAQWLTAKDNPYFARAFANRMWFYFFARGIVHPVDDFRDLNPPTHPGLMTLLSNEFADSGFDVKHLLRCICNSEAYQRTSSVAPGTSDQDLASHTHNYGRFPTRLMAPDVFYDSLKQIYADPKLDLRGINPKDNTTLGQAATVSDPYLEFLRRFGINEEDATEYTHGIPQMLTMLNHPRLLAGSKALETYLKTNPSPDRVVEQFYLSTLSRRPSAEELSEAKEYLGKHEQDYIGILWTLVNRSEFLLIR